MNRLGVATVCGVLLATTGCGAGGSDKSAKVKTFTASGTIKLYATGTMSDGDYGCTGANGFEDITEGAPVVITDAKNTKVGLGELSHGDPGENSTCTFRFVVDKLPSGKGPYAVEVSHRGETPFRESDPSGIDLTLGG